MNTLARLFMILSLVLGLIGCDEVINSPYSEAEREGNTYFSSFSERPRFLDPARVYSTDESAIIAQIYEPPLQYAYFQRPYQLVPLSAATMPKVSYLDKDKKPLPQNVNPSQVAFTVYEIEILPNMHYQPHPAFYYQTLTDKDLKGINTLSDFERTGTRVVLAEDYVYEIKRLADPQINSPIYGFMKEYIIGLEALHDAIDVDNQKGNQPILLKDRTLEGVTTMDDTHYSIMIRGKYPQFMFWLAMPFFSPMPWEADRFYANPALIEKNIVLDWYPVGSGPYYLTENNPNRRMVLSKNPNFHGEAYPTQGMPDQVAAGLLNDAGKPLPFIDTAVLTLEKEAIPRWNKFLQGYYDSSGLASDNYDQAIQSGAGQATVTPALKKLGISLLSETRIASFYWGFNMLDGVVGGYTDQARKLRQAISVAIDMEEYISIFLNERAVPAQSLIPPGIYGYAPLPAGMNTVMYDWEQGRLKRKSVAYAKQLLSEAGYPNGIDPKTGRALVINMDVSSQGDPGEKSRFAWMRKQFSKLGINLNIRATDYNRFRQKLEEGYAQFFGLGWIADYPDPENFLMLLYAPNGKKLASGVNSTNYDNKEFDVLFQKMRQMDHSPERLTLIHRLIEIIQKDAPMVWGYHPEEFLLKQSWFSNVIVSGMANNTLKYQKIDVTARTAMQDKEDKPTFWPAVLVLLVLIAAIVPVWREYRKREKTQHARRIKKS
ncbi:MAG: ABC transporter substrate-binding protein [Gammaproteobacteria bacterium]